MKVRQDAWLKENDELLAEAVLRHVKEGSTQLNAFDEVGDALNRTAAACGFRWNAVVRKMYEDQLAEAKKERKERLRALGNPSRRRVQQIVVTAEGHEAKSIPLSALSLDVVIAYLMRLQHSSGDIESSKWRYLANTATEKNHELEQELEQLRKENIAIREDYEQFVQIMNRARRFVALDEEEERIAPVFKMERNGNLISAPMENNEIQM
ncbi:RsfA family transcriptional regulator [Lysinibacillus louembei]|uniref:RsfA family transcriptional regulator n=1 Tax=Lysinibacillus louembei TaxID=1470088 RepID=A0ABZ0S0C4_9BACI|nr:RsfA family transcriptional regulator [Lysinibacillus louembei]WPK12575.1 RsfA family transcriptional regulator [Lysinibacillus louembei]